MTAGPGVAWRLAVDIWRGLAGGFAVLVTSASGRPPPSSGGPMASMPPAWADDIMAARIVATGRVREVLAAGHRLRRLPRRADGQLPRCPACGVRQLAADLTARNVICLVCDGGPWDLARAPDKGGAVTIVTELLVPAGVLTVEDTWQSLHVPEHAAPIAWRLTLRTPRLNGVLISRWDSPTRDLLESAADVIDGGLRVPGQRRSLDVPAAIHGR
jgi:hypothetical protein